MNVFEKALAFSLKAHEGQMRKRDGTPYILHPCEAASIAATLTNDYEVLAAVVLHDTLEDTDVTAQQIRQNFGDRVAELVQGETETQYPEMSREESWRVRKEGSIRHLQQSDDRDLKIMWLADKLSNMRAFYRRHLVEGDDMWNCFHQKDKNVQEWYYRTIAEALSQLSQTAAFGEYVILMDKVFGGSHED